REHASLAGRGPAGTARAPLAFTRFPLVRYGRACGASNSWSAQFSAELMIGASLHGNSPAYRPVPGLASQRPSRVRRARPMSAARLGAAASAVEAYRWRRTGGGVQAGCAARAALWQAARTGLVRQVRLLLAQRVAEDHRQRHQQGNRKKRADRS